MDANTYIAIINGTLTLEMLRYTARKIKADKGLSSGEKSALMKICIVRSDAIKLRQKGDGDE